MSYYYPQRPTLTSVYDNVGETGVVRPGQRTDDFCPMLSGRGTPGAMLTIIDSGKVLGYTFAGSDGSWHFKPPAPLAAGPHTFSVSSQGYSSTPYNVILDKAPRGALKIESVFDNVGDTGLVNPGEQLDDRRPVVKGSGTPGARISLMENGVVVATAVVDNNGKWSVKPARDLQLGERQLSVYSEGEFSSSYALKVVPVKVVVPEILELIDNVGETGVMHSGDTTDDRRPVLNGTGVPGSTILLMDGGRGIQRAVVNSEGKWTLQIEQPLSTGKHSLSLYSNGVYSGPFTITVTLTEADKPVITRVIDQVGETHDVTPGEQIDDRRPLISGTSRPYMRIVLLDDTGYQIGLAWADGNGHWQLKPNLDLHYGTHQLVVFDGEVRSEPFPITVIALPESAPEIELVRDNVGAPADVTNGGASDDRRPVLSGKGVPGKIIRLLANGVEVGETLVDAHGHWTLKPYSELHLGKTALVVESEGLRSESWEINVVQSLRIDTLFDDVGFTGYVNDGGSTDDTRPRAHGVGIPGEKVKLVYKGITLGSAVVDEKGEWVIEPERDLPPGSHQLRVYSEGVYSEPFYVTISEEQQDAPIIDSLYDNVGAKSYLYESGGHTDDRRPLFDGFGRPGTVFTLLDNGKFVAEITVDDNGQWQYQVEQDLAAGEHSFTLRTETSVSPAFTVTVAELKILAVMDDSNGNIELQPGDITQDERPVLQGVGLPGDIIFLLDNGVKIASGKVDAKGHWTLEPKWDLEAGEHALQVQGRGIKSEVFKLTVTPADEQFDAADVSSLTLQSLLHEADITLFSQPAEPVSRTELKASDLDMQQQSDAKGVLNLSGQLAALPVDDELHSMQY